MSEEVIKLGIVGFGKIAGDQHLPALEADPRYRLVGVATRSGSAPVDVPVFRELGDLLDGVPEIQAVSFCSPPRGRYQSARLALERGMHVMLEKPPGATVCEVEDLMARAHRSGVALFAGWHSRAAAAVASARRWLADRSIQRVVVRWKEDVRQWHPGQTWLWHPGGLGVFDPGINALSLITAILPRLIFIAEASLFYPSNREAPIAATLVLNDGDGLIIDAEFDFRQTGLQTWDIVVDTDAGQLLLAEGGATLKIQGRAVAVGPSTEYPMLYRRFAELIRARTTEVDLTPLRLVADAFLLGRRQTVEPFTE